MTEPAARAATQIAVACTADARYAMPLAVMVRSIVAGLRADAVLVMYVIDDGIEPRDRERIAELCTTHAVVLHWLEPPTALVADLPTWGRIPIAAYYRLPLSDVLPAELEKVIWLDLDLVLATDLARLWEADLDGNTALAVQDVIIPYVSSRGGIRSWQALGLEREAKYFNAGVMVVDLQRWRDDDVGARAIRYLETHRRDVLFLEQEALNAVIAGSWGELDPRWNQNASVTGRPFFSPEHLDADTYRNLVEDPWIVHFNGRVKPWLTRKSADASRGLWFHHLEATPWAGWRPRRTLRRSLMGWYETSRLRRLLYPAEAPVVLLLRRRRLRIGWR